MRDSLPVAEFHAFAAALHAADGVAAFNDDSLLGYHRKQVLWCAAPQSAGECRRGVAPLASAAGGIADVTAGEAPGDRAGSASAAGEAAEGDMKVAATAVWQQEGSVVTAELAVTPAARRQGLASRLVQEIARLADSATRELLVWAHGNFPAQRQFAAALGFTAVRQLQKMVLPDIAAALAGGLSGAGAGAGRDVTSGDAARGVAAGRAACCEMVAAAQVTVRGFTPADSAAWVRLNREIFQAHPEQGRLTLRDLEERLAQPWAQPQNFLLLEDARGELIGYNWLKITPEAAEIYVLGVAPAQAGHGYGKLLLRVGLARLTELGHNRAELYVDAANTAALRLYQRCGFQVVETHTQYRLAAAALRQLAALPTAASCGERAGGAAQDGVTQHAATRNSAARNSAVRNTAVEASAVQGSAVAD